MKDPRIFKEGYVPDPLPDCGSLGPYEFFRWRIDDFIEFFDSKDYDVNVKLLKCIDSFDDVWKMTIHYKKRPQTITKKLTLSFKEI